MNWFWVGLGGFLGATGRYLVDRAVQSAAGLDFPLGTLTVNVLGSFALGVAATTLLKSGPHPTKLHLFLLTGLLGAFTTFSTFSYESLELLRSGRNLAFLGNVGGSVLFCLAGAYLGIQLIG